MYLNFYQFQKEPFHITPDPELFYLSPSHQEAFASVMYGIEQRKGFMAVLGEVGTGKTTVVRSYLVREGRKHLKPIYLFNANIHFDELVRILLKELRVDPEGLSTSEMVHRLHWALFHAYKQGANVAVFIDEAQNMPVETLENLRMLSNLETHKEKLLQIILIGQPELNAKLARHELRQLDQRIVFRAYIAPLTREESFEYLYYRLGQAARTPSRVFTEAALAAIIDRAGGIPRLLNILSDNALIAGYAAQEKPVTAATVRQVIREFDAGRPRRPLGSFLPAPALLKAAACALLIGLGAILTWSIVGRGPAAEAHKQPPAPAAAPVATAAPRAPAASLPSLDTLTAPAVRRPAPLYNTHGAQPQPIKAAHDD